MNAKYDNYQYRFTHFITCDHMHHHTPHTTNNEILKIRITALKNYHVLTVHYIVL